LEVGKKERRQTMSIATLREKVRRLQKHKIIAAIEKAVDDNMERLCYLYERWQDEKEYEDWAEYAAVMSGMFGELFVRATKRPFGCVIRVEGAPADVQVFINRKTCGWEPVK
jgi:hypothetical protein